MLDLEKEPLEELAGELKCLKSSSEKLEVLYKHPLVKEFFNRNGILQTYLAGLNNECKQVLLSVIAIGQEKNLFEHLTLKDGTFEKLRQLTAKLIPVEKFYDTIGGIVGYHVTLLNLIKGEKIESSCQFLKPEGIDITKKNSLIHQAVRKSLDHLGEFAEIYVVGGAGDRLDLRDPVTKEALPAALLPFSGKTLLEFLFRDLEAKEYLHYKLTKEIITTNVVMMTSEEKNNHQYILDILEKNNWFSRGKGSFFLFKQPLVPVVAENGFWVKHGQMDIVLKPGGHGALWKGALTSGAFDWLKNKGCHYALIRQINNPMAAVDHSALGFIGLGLLGKKSFGFASCPRKVGSHEGMNVLLKEVREGTDYYALTNVEYTEFSKKNIEDVPESKDSPYSVFPANTNILFADLKAVQKAAEKNPIPGMLINMKSKTEFVCPIAKIKKNLAIGRLESTMQNIADSMEDRFDGPIFDQTKLKTYLTLNLRRKTISVTKNSFEKSQKLSETKEGCFLDMLHNAYDLLANFCHFDVEMQPDEETYLKNGPAWIFTYHPSLGPLFDLISQKISDGEIKRGSELVIEIPEVSIKGLTLEGSLSILGTSPFGEQNGQRFSPFAPRCELENVTIENQGLRLLSSIGYPNQNFERFENMTIKLNRFSEFSAKNVAFKGNFFIEVPEGYKITAIEENGKVSFHKQKIEKPSWSYDYSYDKDDSIKVTKNFSS